MHLISECKLQVRNSKNVIKKFAGLRYGTSPLDSSYALKKMDANIWSFYLLKDACGMILHHYKSSKQRKHVFLTLWEQCLVLRTRVQW